MLLQEQECFLERCLVSPAQLRSVNVVDTPMVSELLEPVDGVLIGGAGRYSAAEDYEWMPDLLSLVREICRREIPLFGSCWGHQVIARALGGRVEHDLPRAELGCFPVDLTREGRVDDLFSYLPDSFLTNMGHHDRVTVLPQGAVELARNDNQPYQAFRIANLPVYGTQFHSELSAQRERERLLEYRDAYRSALPSEEQFQEVLDSLAETSEADDLLSKFIDRFVVAAPVKT